MFPALLPRKEIDTGFLIRSLNFPRQNSGVWTPYEMTSSVGTSLSDVRVRA